MFGMYKPTAFNINRTVEGRQILNNLDAQIETFINLKEKLRLCANKSVYISIFFKLLYYSRLVFLCFREEKTEQQEFFPGKSKTAINFYKHMVFRYFYKIQKFSTNLTMHVSKQLYRSTTERRTMILDLLFFSLQSQRSNSNADESFDIKDEAPGLSPGDAVTRLAKLIHGNPIDLCHDTSISTANLCCEN